jgi:endosialidase-like protein
VTSADGRDGAAVEGGDSQTVAGAPVNGFTILDSVARLPISTWRYEWEPEDVRHLGPMAQDWKAMFGLGGPDDTRIPVVDVCGVALVAIQALQREITELRAELDELRDR